MGISVYIQIATAAELARTWYLWRPARNMYPRKIIVCSKNLDGASAHQGSAFFMVGGIHGAPFKE